MKQLSESDRTLLVLGIEKAFEACEHPHTDVYKPDETAWCNICGAIRLPNVARWFHPHRRDLLVKLFALGMFLLASCTGGDIKLVQHKNPADRFLDAGDASDATEESDQ